eukprot:3514980-Rhodomonas_salina.2
MLCLDSITTHEGSCCGRLMVFAAPWDLPQLLNPPSSLSSPLLRPSLFSGWAEMRLLAVLSF